MKRAWWICTIIVKYMSAASHLHVAVQRQLAREDLLRFRCGGFQLLLGPLPGRVVAGTAQRSRGQEAAARGRLQLRAHESSLFLRQLGVRVVAVVVAAHLWRMASTSFLLGIAVASRHVAHVATSSEPSHAARSRQSLHSAVSPRLPSQLDALSTRPEFSSSVATTKTHKMPRY